MIVRSALPIAALLFVSIAISAVSADGTAPVGETTASPFVVRVELDGRFIDAAKQAARAIKKVKAASRQIQKDVEALQPQITAIESARTNLDRTQSHIDTSATQLKTAATNLQNALAAQESIAEQELDTITALGQRLREARRELAAGQNSLQEAIQWHAQIRNRLEWLGKNPARVYETEEGRRAEIANLQALQTEAVVLQQRWRNAVTKRRQQMQVAERRYRIFIEGIPIRKQASPATLETLAPPPAVTGPAAVSNTRQVVDAFWRRPYISPIEHAEVLEDFEEFPATEPDAKGEKDDKSKSPDSPGSASLQRYQCDHRFDDPAVFPLTSFNRFAPPVHEEGAVIYEGMRFAVREDGRYQVRFLIGTPAMPVTLRLQVVLRAGDGSQYTVTLPPITIPSHDPDAEIVQQVHENIQLVHHEGYLPAIQGLGGNLAVVRREGTARFGFGVDVP